MHDQRLIERLTHYWNSMCRGKDMPRFAQFNSSAIADIWQQCLLFSVQPGSSERSVGLIFQMIGDQLQGIYGQEMLGAAFSHKHRHFQGAAVVGRAGEVLASPAPLIDIGQFACNSGKMIKFRSCLLPFGQQGVVTHIVAGLSWREF